MTRRKAPDNSNLLQWLEEGGVTITDIYAPFIWGKTDNLYFLIRTDLEHISIGVRSSFDRWANSRDFVLNFIPHDEIGVKAVVAAAEDECKNRHFDTAWAVERDLYPAYRRERKRLRAGLRLPVEEESM